MTVLHIFHSHPTEWRLFLTVWLVYLFHLAPLTGANENRYLDLVRGMVDEGRFVIDTYHYNTIDKSYYNGHYYAGAAPGPAMLAIPAYLLFKAAEPFLPASLFGQYDKASYIRGYLKGTNAPDAFVEKYPFGRLVLLHLLATALTCSLLSALTAVLVYRVCRRVTPDASQALLIGLAYAFGTTAFYYSTRLYPHVAGGFFAFLGFVLIAIPRMKREEISHARAFWAGLCGGAAVLMDYAAAPAAGCVGLYVALSLKDRRIAPAITGGLIPVLILLGYHTLCFGNPFTTPYGLPNGPMDDGTHLHYNENFHGFSLPPLNQIWGLSFGVFRGVFWYIPLAFPAVYGLIHALRIRHPFRLEWIMIACLVVCQFLFNAMMHPNYWYGGWEFGPRFLTPMLPFLILPLVFINTQRRGQSLALYTLVATSMLINWIGVQYAPSNSLFGTIAMFFLSGPSPPLYLFVSNYIRTYTTWAVTVSPLGGFLLLGVVIRFLWTRRALPAKEC